MGLVILTQFEGHRGVWKRQNNELIFYFWMKHLLIVFAVLVTGILTHDKHVENVDINERLMAVWSDGRKIYLARYCWICICWSMTRACIHSGLCLCPGLRIILVQFAFFIVFCEMFTSVTTPARQPSSWQIFCSLCFWHIRDLETRLSNLVCIG